MSKKTFLPKGTNGTPFNPQLSHFDLICGQVMAENRMWKSICIVSLLAFFISIGICFYAITRPQSIPVLITMNDFGETSYIGPVSRKNYQNFNIPEIAIQYQVKDFIELTNTLSTDRAVMQKSLRKIYHLLTATTADRFNVLLKENNPYKNFGSQTKEVLFETEPLKISKDSYQLDYHIVTRRLSGNILSDETFRAVITVKCLQPNDDDIKDNPLGIYITSFDFKSINTNIYDSQK